MFYGRFSRISTGRLYGHTPSPGGGITWKYTGRNGMKTIYRELVARTLKASALEAIFATSNASILMQLWMNHTESAFAALTLKMVQEKPKRLVIAPQGVEQLLQLDSHNGLPVKSMFGGRFNRLTATLIRRIRAKFLARRLR